MLTIGLTGGIASGKSTVSREFEKYNIRIIDTDLISRSIMNNKQPAYIEVVNRYGEDILLDDQTIDRKSLREIVFQNSDEKAWLESIVHPLIREESLSQASANSDSPYQLMVVPLMFETSFHQLVDRVLTIDCPRKAQLKRLINRDGISNSLAQSMLEQQLSNEARIELADDVLPNYRTLDNLTAEIEKLHFKYLQLSSCCD